jgi:putative peptidoglycan lipid II flippase
LANDLSLPIIGLVAVPFATAVFPALSLSFSKGNRKEMVQKFSSVFRQILFLIIPLSAIAFILRAHLVRIVFGTGRFDWSSTKLTAACFGIFMFGLFAQGLIYLLAKAFYSMHNTRVPALVSVISVITTALFALLFVWIFSFQNFFSYFFTWFLKIEGMKNLSVLGLPLAISFDALIQMLILIVFLRRKLIEWQIKEILLSLEKILAATLFTIIFTYIIRQSLGGFMGSKTFWILFLQAGTAGALGFLVYVLFAWLFKSPEVKSLKNFILSQIGFLNFQKNNGKN